MVVMELEIKKNLAFKLNKSRFLNACKSELERQN